MRTCKKVLAVILALCMAVVLTVSPAGVKKVRAAVSGNFEYEPLTESTVIITKYTETEDSPAELTVPGTIDGKDVTAIGEQAFQSCKRLNRVTLTPGLTSIGNEVFLNCENLEKISIPSSVTSIGRQAFSECSSLKTVNYSGTLQQWENIEIAAENDQLKQADIQYINSSSPEDYTCRTLSDGTIEITGYTGSDQTLVIPGSINGIDVTSIGEYAFNGCKSMKEVTIPSSVTAIQPYAFYRSSITKVKVPSSVDSIGQSAFQDCEALTEIEVEEGNVNYASHEGVLYNKEKTLLISCPSGKAGTYEVDSSVKNIADNAFFGCTKLTGITLPSGLTSIQEAAFRGCSGLTGITLPSGLTSIGTFAFAGCSSLKNIVIPANVSSIGSSAFRDCTGLEGAELSFGINCIETGVFAGCSSLKSISVPSSVTYIGQEAFYDCKSLAAVTIPESVASVQKSAFGKCSSLGNVRYAGSKEQWNKITVSMEGSADENNQPLLNATITFNNGTTINGPEKDADYKIGTVSAYDQAGKTVRISGRIYAAADSLAYGGLDQMVSSKEQIIATFQNGKVTKIESLKHVFRCKVTVREASKPPITLQSSGYLEDTQDIQICLEAESSYPQSAFQGLEDIGLDVSEMTVSVDREGFCIKRMDAERDETSVSIEEPVNRKLALGSVAEYIYTVYVRKGFTFTEKELPYTINVKAETDNGTASSGLTLYAFFEITQQEINVADARQELESLKSDDSLSLERDFHHYLSPEQIDVIETYLYTWLAEVNYTYKYSGGSGIKALIMKKAGIDPEGDFESGTEQAITHISVETKYGTKTFEITIDLGKPDSSKNLYPAYGTMHYEVLEKDGLPSDVPKSGVIGRDSYTGMGAFAECVGRASEESLHGTYQWQSLDDEMSAGVLVDKTVMEIIGSENGSFASCFFTVYAQPLFKYSKKVTISCPVDVYVYQMNGRDVGSIVNNKAYKKDQNVLLDVNGESKTVYLTGNDYYLKLHGTDTGTMKYEVEEIANEEVCRKVQFLELQLKDQMEYEGYVFRPLNIDKDLYALRTKGSSSQEVFYADNDSYKPSFKQIEGLTLSQKNSSLAARKTVQLSASLQPLDASNPNLTWTTDNESVARVDSSGLVTAVGAGRTTITVATKDGSFLKQFCLIDVSSGSSSGSSSGGSSGGSYGWSGGGMAPSSGQTAKPEVVKLHYIVQFNMNGGTKLSRKTMTLQEGDSPGIMPKVQRKDYTFDGWYTQQEGGTKVAGDKPLDEAATLYARWTKTTAPAKPASLALQSKKKGQIRASFQKVSGAAGYQVEYDTSKKFAAAKAIEAGAAAKSKTVTGLKAGTKYYVRIRAYSVDSMGNRIYGTYSTIKSVKVKA